MPVITSTTRVDFIKLKRERQAAERRQLEGFESSELFKLTVESKLTRAGACGNWWLNFQRCGREPVILRCANCQIEQTRTYQCNLKWCPSCNWRITERRKKLLELTTKGLPDAMKHVVLTQRNFPELTAAKIRNARANLLRLRRQKIGEKIHGGCASLEFTNEKEGWHMHWHLLLHTAWIEASKLSIAWGRLVGQEFAIVKVMELRDRSYLQEVCKYVVTGSELAKWTPEQILQFVTSLQKTRLFTVFGSFIGARKCAAAQIKKDRPPPPICECGCSAKIFGRDEAETSRKFWRQFV